jgi:CDP-glucose 4,6-dehydratase
MEIMAVNKADNIMSFWKNKRVFITGHTGFKGGWLSLWLKSKGAILGGYSLPAPTEPSLYQTVNISSLLEKEWISDVKELHVLKTALGEFNPDIVLHLAAQPLVRYSYAEPIETFQTNVIGTINLLEGCRDLSNLKSVVIVTTDKCYENKEFIWSYREHDPMGGHDPYSASKACAELATASYAKSFFQSGNVHISTARAGNVIGGGDWSRDRLLVDIIQSLSVGKPIVLRNPKSVRPWQHVLEPLNGYLILAEKLYRGECSEFEGWNFGPNNDRDVTVEAIANIAVNVWGDGVINISSDAGPHEANHLTLDSTKAKLRLKWRPKYTVEDSVEFTVQWYRQQLLGANMIDYTIGQIEAFESAS